MNPEFEQAFQCLSEASNMLAAGREDDACLQIEQASAILDAVMAAWAEGCVAETARAEPEAELVAPVSAEEQVAELEELVLTAA